MKDSQRVVPVVLFTHTRTTHLEKTLASLRRNRIPKLYVYSDGPRTPGEKAKVEAVREIILKIDWCDVELRASSVNRGLGVSIVSGVAEVLREHEYVIVFEDDLICLPGTYEYLASALRHYQHDEKVMSVTGWTHPRITPSGLNGEPYFDGRTECWVWGTWSRSWSGMEESAATLVAKCRARGLDICSYGADLPAQARNEKKRNLWAVRWLFLHLLSGGLCLRPPWSMVEHIGFDATGSNAVDDDSSLAQSLRAAAPPIPAQWPRAAEHPQCRRLWQKMFGASLWSFTKLRQIAIGLIRRTRNATRHGA